MDALGLPRDVTVINSGMLAYAKVEMFDEVVQVSEVSSHSTAWSSINIQSYACAAFVSSLPEAASNIYLHNDSAEWTASQGRAISTKCTILFLRCCFLYSILGNLDADITKRVVHPCHLARYC